MRCFQQVAAGVDVVPLLLELERQPHLWDKNPCRLYKKAPHHETHDIFIRYKDERPHIESSDFSTFCDPHFADWYQSSDLLPTARKLAMQLMARFEGEVLGGVLLYKVPAGKRIYPHTDPGWHPEFYDKFNVCIKSNPNAAFVYPNEQTAMVQRMGDVHWFRNDLVHEVVNHGNDDHIVLTVCMRLDRGVRVPWSPEGWTMDKMLAEKGK